MYNQSRSDFSCVVIFFRFRLTCLNRASAAFYPIHDRHPIPYFAPVRTRSGSRLLGAVRVDTLPHAHHPRTVCKETSPWTRHLGHHARRNLFNGVDVDILGRSGSPAVMLEEGG